MEKQDYEKYQVCLKSSYMSKEGIVKPCLDLSDTNGKLYLAPKDDILKDHPELSHKSLMEMQIDHLAKKVNNQFDKILTEGLKRKGFEFERNAELVHFIKTRCRSEDYQKEGIKIFLVDDVPFMKWDYKNQEIKQEGNVFTATNGAYQYL
ncbi:hypothetical protein [Marinifilum flexuosum]|uniref:Uncharacterized protein n=1 Tax=Marinifilum flexuosum TaxID=1117708 RepID=A0A419WMR1_9BACT|nr:hypothetical protein [Marinifilum flexuosum]RKD96773.1 hypothetical protein BXY64_3720 [Marinifilum flexuosum]